MRTHTRENTHAQRLDSIDQEEHGIDWDGRSRPSRGRQIAGALVIMAGAIPIALIARSDYYGRPPRLWSVILAIGVVSAIAWVVDGHRYLGVAAGAAAIGSAFTLAQEVDFEKYQFALIFGLLGVGLLLVRMINSRAVGATAGLLMAIGASAATWQYLEPLDFNEAWVYVPLMGVWGFIQLLRALHGRKKDGKRFTDSRNHRDNDQDRNNDWDRNSDRNNDRNRDWDNRDLDRSIASDDLDRDTIELRDGDDTSRREERDRPDREDTRSDRQDLRERISRSRR